ncbi:hypothetical protein MIB92_16925 [Aestuariirhabdus sp. Z084]|uniref:hypothetical protein n=1 Tax=Aestuariirhabdus haliotis TaxID=2918751 RepID=UPI00201B410E|nr:hypothetical protein [Aestuariirhabdus haliotis]MCL6417345.1 hypothetical protein [Aestuariirhabdus haliotis]MCL6421290.1 hypothetical protein [Aestuariirhabdus haliotis]
MRHLIALLLLISSPAVFGSNAGEPLERASKAYLATGADAFIPALVEGSALEGQEGILAQVAILQQVEGVYGAYEGFDVIYEKNLTSRVRLVYYVMNYEKSPLFGVATYYQRNDKEIVTNLNFNTQMWNVLPGDVVFN